MKKKFKIKKQLLSLFLLIFFILFPLRTFHPKTEFSSNKLLEVIFLDVGQGDSVLIKTPYQQKILIDGGPNEKIIYQLSKNLSFDERKFDLIILTHPHSDHLSGLIEVLKKYEVEKILLTGVIHTSPTYLYFLDLIKKKNISTEIAFSDKVLNFGEDLKMEIISPTPNYFNQKVENLDNISIVSKLIFKKISFLFTGDINQEKEKELLEKNLKSNVLKIAHHGSKTSSSKEFLEEVKSEIAIIQVGKDNLFGHPSRSVLRRLEKSKTKILRTDLNGEIKVLTDGERLDVRY